MNPRRRRQSRYIKFYDLNNETMTVFDFTKPQYTKRREEIRYQNKNGYIFPLVSLYNNEQSDLQNNKMHQNQSQTMKNNAQYQFILNYFQKQFKTSKKISLKSMKCANPENIEKNDSSIKEDHDEDEVLNQTDIEENNNQNENQLTNFFDLKLDDFDEDENIDEFNFMDDILEMQ